MEVVLELGGEVDVGLYVCGLVGLIWWVDWFTLI